MKKRIPKNVIRYTTDTPVHTAIHGCIPTHTLYGYLTLKTSDTCTERLYFLVNPDKIRLTPPMQIGNDFSFITPSMSDWYHVKSLYVNDRYTQMCIRSIRKFVLDTLKAYPKVLSRIQNKPHHTVTHRSIIAEAPHDRVSRIDTAYRMKPDTGTHAITQRTNYRELTAEAHWNFTGSASQRACNMRYDV